MILADKIAELRKKNGWSQEELAGQLGVSRQSVSKWESASSMPDLDKILKMSEIFGVSTDYLLKDSNGPDEEAIAVAAPDTIPDPGSDSNIRTVSLEEADTFINITQDMAAKVAAGVSLCILSPILMILLCGLSDKEGGYILPEAPAVAVGLTVLLVMVAAAVSIFIWYARKVERFEYLEKEPVELAYGVTGVVEKRKKGYEPSHGISLVIGVVLCILSAVPVLVLGVLDEEGMLAILGVIFCLVIISAGVFFLVRTCVIFGAFQKLLEEGDYSRDKKLADKRNETVTAVYWCIVTAVYLGWSFYTMEWHRTWIIWPCAAVLFAAVLGISEAVHKK